MKMFLGGLSLFLAIAVSVGGATQAAHDDSLTCITLNDAGTPTDIDLDSKSSAKQCVSVPSTSMGGYHLVVSHSSFGRASSASRLMYQYEPFRADGRDSAGVDRFVQELSDSAEGKAHLCVHAGSEVHVWLDGDDSASLESLQLEIVAKKISDEEVDIVCGQVAAFIEAQQARTLALRAGRGGVESSGKKGGGSSAEDALGSLPGDSGSNQILEIGGKKGTFNPFSLGGKKGRDDDDCIGKGKGGKGKEGKAGKKGRDDDDSNMDDDENDCREKNGRGKKGGNDDGDGQEDDEEDEDDEDDPTDPEDDPTDPENDPSRDMSAPPSLSMSPSISPSTSPSTSVSPSSAPSSVPSISSAPSDSSSTSPSISSAPSVMPSTHPSLSSEPSETPSSKPSVSAAPSVSGAPSVSAAPSEFVSQCNPNDGTGSATCLDFLKANGIPIDCPVCEEQGEKGSGIGKCQTTPTNCMPQLCWCKRTMGTFNCANGCGVNDSCYKRPLTTSMNCNANSRATICDMIFMNFLTGAATSQDVDDCLSQ